jgi:hypothetical protein
MCQSFSPCFDLGAVDLKYFLNHKQQSFHGVDGKVGMLLLSYSGYELVWELLIPSILLIVGFAVLPNSFQPV